MRKQHGEEPEDHSGVAGDEHRGEHETIRPLYRVTKDPQWFAKQLHHANHLLQKSDDGQMRCVTHARPAADCVRRLPTDLVWNNSLDGGRYTVTVTRTKPYSARLTVVREEHIVAEQDVGLMYNAEFGADVEDIRLWETIGIQVADSDYRRRGENPPQ